MVCILTLSTVVYSQESEKPVTVVMAEKLVTVKPELFSPVYPALWFSPSTGDLAALQSKSEKPPVSGYEIWIEPGDPEMGFPAKGNVGFMLIGNGESAFNSPDIPGNSKMKKKVEGAYLKMAGSKKPVFYVKGMNSSCVIMLTELDRKKEIIKFKWKLIESNETKATIKEIKRIAVKEGKTPKFSVTVDKNNVVSSRIEGDWVVNADLSAVLSGKGVMEGVRGKKLKISFRKDHSIIKDLPLRYYRHLKDKKIYTCGFMTIGGKTYPFYLTHITGNPHILYFRKRKGVPMGDSESFNVMLAVAKDKANDMLFIGGDFNNQPFTAYKRPVQTQDNRQEE
jgi:hypothetical protein